MKEIPALYGKKLIFYIKNLNVITVTNMEIYKSFRIEAAHRLPNLPSHHKCSRLHGHSFVIEVHLSGEIDKSETETLPIFNLKIPKILAGLDRSILDPRASYSNSTEWVKRARHLGGLFIENFEKFTDTESGRALIAAGPQLD